MRSMPQVPQSETIVTKLLELARLDSKYLEDLEKFRRQIAVMFTDIRGSTSYFEQHGDVAGLLLVHECNSMIRRVVEQRGGRIIKNIGDGSLSTFEDCAQGASAAVDIQHALADMNASRKPEEQPAIRIGIHYGTGIVKSNDVFGDVVNTASRVESTAMPGQIVASEEFHDQIKAAGFRCAELGRFSLKGKAGERLLFEISWRETPDSTVPPTAPFALSAAAPREAYRVQVISIDGAVGAEYALTSSLSIGRSQGDIRFPSDAAVAPLHARIFLDKGQVFVQDVSNGGESVFMRLSAAYTLRNGDVIIMGDQAFTFYENSALLSAGTMVGATFHEIARAADGVVAELCRLDASGNPAERFPLGNETVELGRTQGNYTFPQDRRMSRLHARVLQRGEDFVLEDAGSRNGTFVRVMGKAVLPVDSAILLGSHLLRLTRRA